MSAACSLQNLAERLRDLPCHARADLEISRHLFAGRASYVLRDPLTRQTHRLSREDYQVFAALRPGLTLGEAFQRLVAQRVLKAEDEQRFYQYVVELQRLGVLQLPGADGGRLFKTFEQNRRNSARQRRRGFLFTRIPLWNPDAFLTRTMPWLRPLFHPAAAIAWVVALAVCLATLTLRWHDFVSPLSGLLAPSQLGWLWATLFALKVWHELGHGYACKHYGGDVPEIGAFLIVLAPCAYVDAGAAWSFPSRWQRILVNLGGMYFESLAAMAAFLVWNLTAPGPLNAWAHQVVVLATVVTLVFNANPLLRYDGYFVLSDWSGRPNLRQEARAELLRLLKKWFLGLPRPNADSTDSQRRPIEKPLVAFALASGLYKTTVVIGISFMIAQRFHVLGLLLAAYYLANTWGRAAVKMARHLWTDPETAPVRARAIAVSAVALAAPAVVLALPVPGGLTAPGWLARQREHRVEVRQPGSVRRVACQVGDRVRADALLFEVDRDEADAQLAASEAALSEELQRQQSALTAVAGERRQAQQSEQRIQHLRRQLNDARQAVGERQLRAGVNGQITQLAGARITGRYARPGEVLAVVSGGDWLVRALLSSEQMTVVRPAPGQAVQVQLLHAPERTLSGIVRRVLPQAGTQVANPLVTQLAGGPVTVAPDTLRAAMPHHEIEIEIEPAANSASDLLYHAPVQVRFASSRQSLGNRLWRRLLRLRERLLTQ